MKDKVFVLLRIFISFGLLGLLFWLMRDEVRDVVRIMLDSRVSLIFIATGLIPVSYTHLTLPTN